MFGRFSKSRSCGGPPIVPSLVHARWTTAMLGSLLALGGAGILHAAPQHPNLFVNAGELDQLRMKLKTEPWRAGLLEQVKQDADGGNPVAAAVVYAMTGDCARGAKVRARPRAASQGLRAPPKGTRPVAQYPWGPEAGMPSPSTWRRRCFRRANSRP